MFSGATFPGFPWIRQSYLATLPDHDCLDGECCRRLHRRWPFGKALTPKRGWAERIRTSWHGCLPLGSPFFLVLSFCFCLVERVGSYFHFIKGTAYTNGPLFIITKHFWETSCFSSPFLYYQSFSQEKKRVEIEWWGNGSLRRMHHLPKVSALFHDRAGIRMFLMFL